MRALVVCSWALIGAALAGCTYDFEHDGPECVRTAIVDGETLRGTSLEGLSKRALPPVSGELEARGTVCDLPGTESDEPDERRRFQTLEGVPPQAALLADGYIYYGEGFLIATKGHPLYRVFARELHTDPRPIRGCREGRLRGTVIDSPRFSKSFRLSTAGRRRDVTMHPDLEANLPSIGGLPRLTRGMRIVAHGKRCRSGRFYAFRLTRRR